MAECRLYLPLGAGFSGPVSLVEAALRAGRSPSLLITGSGNAARIGELAAAAHRQDAAALLEGDPDQAAALGLDGVHLTGDIDVLREARARLGPDKAIGVDAPLSRHAAMTLAELGADYIAFGRQPAEGETLDALTDMIAWWSELFEIPCVACLPAEASETAWRQLVAAGPDFLLPDVAIWDEPDTVLARAERLALLCDGR